MMSFTVRTRLLFSCVIALASGFARGQVAPSASPGQAGEVRANTAVVPVPRDPRWVQRHEGFVKIAQQGGIDVLFLGDSITDFWRYDTFSGPVDGKPVDWPRGKAVWDQNFAPLHAANFGINADRTQHVLWRIDHGELDGIHPKVVVLMIGTNNTGMERNGGVRNTTAEAIAGVTAVVRDIRSHLPESKILLLAIFPRDTKDSPIRAQIQEVNRAIALLDDGVYIHYLDIGPKFLEPDGTLSRDIFPDLLHPNARGYQIWADAIRAPLAELMK
jgi:lysophospholipase L1-like esterase